MDSRSVARAIAEESMVLLKNEHSLLPLKKGSRAAFFGRTQLDTIYSGNGSGAAGVKNCRNILTACEEAGIRAETGLKAYYQKQYEEELAAAKNSGFDFSKIKELVNSGMMYEFFGKYKAPSREYEIPEEIIRTAREETDTAIFVLGRNSGGEECDRHLYGDYYLTDSEKALVDLVCERFEKVVLILNLNGLVDLSWTKEKTSIRSILFIGIPGEEGAGALADILTGEVNPSGKLAVTIAEKYEDYPAWADFSWDKDHPETLKTYGSYGLDAGENGSEGFALDPVTVYREDLYLGYRYFDTFGVKPLYPFGFGLSYTSFGRRIAGAEETAEGLSLKIAVKNTGGVPGKETVQIYAVPDTRLENRPLKELKGFEKTCLLSPGEEQLLDIRIPWEAFAIYEEESAARQIPSGRYTLLAGTSSADTEAAVTVLVPETITVEKLQNRLGLKSCNAGRIDFLEAPEKTETEAAEAVFTLTKDKMPPQRRTPSDAAWKSRMEKAAAAVKELSIPQLTALLVGYGPGTPFAALGDGTDPSTIFYEDGTPVTVNDHPTGWNGYVSPAVPEKEIPSISYKDGPAGVGMVAWPTEMLSACSFNRELWYAFGDAVGEECEQQSIDFWLAPAVNLHRHPLGGRNFEYPSEDPYLAGVFGCQVAKGTQENHPVLVCPKHFAVNEQETYRRGSSGFQYNAVDSILRERTARELYLKPFEMLVKEAGVRCLMTSFNRINGTFAGESRDLCTHILREEWGYEGYVVTDWGDMDIVIDGADAVAAGNDIIMPGGPPVIAQIQKGYEEGRITRPQMEQAVLRLLGSNIRYGI